MMILMTYANASSCMVASKSSRCMYSRNANDVKFTFTEESYSAACQPSPECG